MEIWGPFGVLHSKLSGKRQELEDIPGGAGCPVAGRRQAGYNGSQR